MRMPFSPRRSLLGASTLLLFASSLALLTPGDASAAQSRDVWLRRKYYSDASLTTQVGVCDMNAGCSPGYITCAGTQTPYYTTQIITYC